MLMKTHSKYNTIDRAILVINNSNLGIISILYMFKQNEMDQELVKGVEEVKEVLAKNYLTHQLWRALKKINFPKIKETWSLKFSEQN